MLLYKRAKLIVLVAIIFAIVGGAVTFLFPLEYRAESQIFIISQTRQGVDPYTTIKSAERIGENLSELLKTDDFFQKVLSQEGFTIDGSRFSSLSDRERRKLWKKSVQGSVVYGTGVFTVTAYHTDPAQAAALSGAAAQTLVSHGWQYVGGDVIIRLVNPPVVSQFPVRPNIVLNAALGFVAGMMLMGVLVVKRG